MDISDYNKYIEKLTQATTADEIQAISPQGFESLAGMRDWESRRSAALAKTAVPILQRLTDYQNQGWSSDPSFTGKEWTEGLLNTPALNAPGTLPPDMSNPNVLAAVTGFASQAQNEKSYSDQLQRMGTPVQDAGSMARFALDPGMLPHLTSLEKAPAAFSPPVEDKASTANREFMVGLPEVYSAPVAEQPSMLAGLIEATGADPKFAFDSLKQVQSQNVVEKPDASRTEEQLTTAALAGDKGAQAVLDAMQNRRIRIARESRPPRATGGGMGGNLNINGLSSDQSDALGRAIDNGLDPYKINSRTAKIYADQEIRNPGRKWNELGATAAFERNAGVMNTKALLNAIDPILVKLEESGAVLGNSNIPFMNRIRNTVKEQTGQSDIVGFNNLRDDAIAEVERGLLGSGVLSDSKYNRAIKNINSAQSLPQLKAAIKNTRFVIAARLEALAKGPSAKPAGETARPPAAKTVVKKFTSASTGKTKFVYSDGSEEIR